MSISYSRSSHPSILASRLRRETRVPVVKNLIKQSKKNKIAAFLVRIIAKYRKKLS